LLNQKSGVPREWKLDIKAMEAAFAYYKKASATEHSKEDCNNW